MYFTALVTGRINLLKTPSTLPRFAVWRVSGNTSTANSYDLHFFKTLAGADTLLFRLASIASKCMAIWGPVFHQSLPVKTCLRFFKNQPSNLQCQCLYSSSPSSFPSGPNCFILPVASVSSLGFWQGPVIIFSILDVSSFKGVFLPKGGGIFKPFSDRFFPSSSQSLFQIDLKLERYGWNYNIFSPLFAWKSSALGRGHVICLKQATFGIITHISCIKLADHQTPPLTHFLRSPGSLPQGRYLWNGLLVPWAKANLQGLLWKARFAY